MAITDKEIISTVKAKPETGFRLLLAKYREPVYWHIRRLVVTHADAEDATQETFVRIFRSFSSHSESSSFAAWIYRIATNEALRLIGRKREGRVSLDSNPGCVGTVTTDNYIDYGDLEAVRLQQAILSLPTKQQLTFNLRYYDELSFNEIGDITGSSAATAKVNYHLAKNKIIEFINSHD